MTSLTARWSKNPVSEKLVDLERGIETCDPPMATPNLERCVTVLCTEYEASCETGGLTARDNSEASFIQLEKGAQRREEPPEDILVTNGSARAKSASHGPSDTSSCVFESTLDSDQYVLHVGDKDLLLCESSLSAVVTEKSALGDEIADEDPEEESLQVPSEGEVEDNSKLKSSEARLSRDTQPTELVGLPSSSDEASSAPLEEHKTSFSEDWSGHKAGVRQICGKLFELKMDGEKKCEKGKPQVAAKSEPLPSREEEYADSHFDKEKLLSPAKQTFEQAEGRTEGRGEDSPKAVAENPQHTDEDSETANPVSPETTNKTTALVEPLFDHKQTMLIFDWDDTLLPSTWLSENNLTLEDSSVVGSEAARVLNSVAECAKQTLEMADKFGTVVIVTNAEHGWVQLSCRKFIPSLAPHIAKYRILSARSLYESSMCQSPYMWKLRAFKTELDRHYNELRHLSGTLARNIVSLGDSTHERQALLSSCRCMEERYEHGIFAKSIKFLERPNLDDLKREHELITDVFHDLIHHNGTLDLCIRSSMIASQSATTKAPDLPYSPIASVQTSITEKTFSQGCPPQTNVKSVAQNYVYSQGVPEQTIPEQGVREQESAEKYSHLSQQQFQTQKTSTHKHAEHLDDTASTTSSRLSTTL